MKILALLLTLWVGGFATQQQAPISADEVTLRHRVYGDGRVTIFLLCGWDAGIRTPISRVRVCCPTVGRPPSASRDATTGVNHRL
jgi:hypothetical protein